MTDALMPIGRFARSCRLTVKALCHYDAEGLLAPVHVDPVSGYRYYSRRQAREAILIGMLRTLGIGIPMIRAILRDPAGTRLDLLEAEMDRLRREILEREQALRSIRRVVEARDPFPYDVHIRVERSILVAQRQISTTLDRLIPETTAVIYDLMEAVRRAGRPVLMPVLCMNDYGAADDGVTVFACAAMEPPGAAIDGATVAELPGGEMACLMHRGAYEELGVAYHALNAWVQEHGHDEAGLVREVYHNDPADVAPADLLTELLLPIRSPA